MRLWVAALIASATAGAAGAAPGCDFYAFRDAMAAQRDAEFDALLATCKREGRWPEREDGALLVHLAPHVRRQRAAAYTRALLAAGLAPNTTTRDRHDPVTPLGMAARFDCGPCVQALLAAGADAQVRSPDGANLLHEAGAQTIALLIDAGLSVADRDSQGNVPLHRVWHPALLSVGVNVVNDAGLTPLHAAALSDHPGRVHALLSAGADPALRTTRDSRWRLSGISRGFGPGLVVRRGATALDLARDQQASARFSTQTHVEVVKQLQAVTPRPGLLGR